MAGHRRRHQLPVARRERSRRLALGVVGLLPLALVVALSLGRCGPAGDAPGGGPSDAGDVAPTGVDPSPEGPGGAGGLCETRSYETGSDIVETSRELLAGYRDAGDCVLVRAGYLDLLGSMWSCTVSFGDSVEVCVVAEAASGDSCEVRVMRMEVRRWEEAYGGETAGPPGG